MKRFNIPVGLGILLWGLLSGGLLANPATAVFVTFNFTGTVPNVGSNLGASSFGGSPIFLSGSYRAPIRSTQPLPIPVVSRPSRHTTIRFQI